MAEPLELGEYVDANGLTFQTTARKAEARGWKKVTGRRAEAKVVEADDAADKPSTRSRASTK